ncbi:hypothetical protein CI238_11567 [Colletotrichum incanum]|uniref:Uncharacterized protein n=1 Tax=Colletotrichum incanum TaxID=1573173 RepID=A0A166LKW1_COLIC|nr:hypothetical protein CI238_11567 [Colletotrichum incanum]
MVEMGSTVGWEMIKDNFGPCKGCGRDDQHVAVSDTRCAAYEKMRVTDWQSNSSQLEADQQRAVFDAWWQDSEQLRQTLAREDEYISSLHAAINEAYSRRTRFQEDFNARWGNPAQIHAGFVASALELAGSKMRAYGAVQEYGFVNAIHIANQALALAEPEEESGEEWSDKDDDKENERPAHGRYTYTAPREQPGCQANRTEQSQADANGNAITGVGSVERWLAWTLDTAPERSSHSLEMGDSVESPWSMSPSENNERPGDRVKLPPATRHRYGSLSREERARKHGAPTQRQRIDRHRACLHHPYSHH